MNFRRQLFRPGRWIERIGKLSSMPLLARKRPVAAKAYAANDGLAASRPLSLRLAEHVGGAFSLLLGVVLLVALVAFVVAFTKELRSDVVVLEGFSAPPDLVARGYTPTVIAENILDEIRAIQKGASSTRQPRILESSAEVPDIDVAHGAFSMRALVRYTRRFLGLPENAIGGEIIRNDRALKANIRFRERSTGEVSSIESADGDADALLKDVARSVVRAADPYMLAAFLFDEERRQSDHPFRETLATIDYVLTHPRGEDDAWALMLLGKVRRVQNRFAEAADDYREAMRRSPAIPFAKDNLAQVLYFAGRIDEAASLIPASAPNPRWSEAELRTRAGTLVIQNRFEEAYSFASAALTLSPDDEDARELLTESLKQLHRPAEGLAVVERSMSPVTKQGPIDYDYVELLIATGRSREALEFAKRAATAGSQNDLHAYGRAYALGLALAANGRYEEALAAYKRASIVMTEASPLWIAWGDALLGLHEPQQALAKMQLAAELDRTFGASHAGVGRALLALGRTEEAERSFAKACELDRHDPATLRAWAQVLDSLNRRNEAAEKRSRADIVERENGVPLTAGKRAGGNQG